VDSSQPPSFDKSDRYQDKSIFKFQNRFIQYFDTLSQFLEEQEKIGSKFRFPEKEIRQVCLLNFENSEKYFYVYDIYMNRLTRKILKQDFYDLYSMS
jgi:hypothetical protein